MYLNVLGISQSFYKNKKLLGISKIYGLKQTAISSHLL